MNKLLLFLIFLLPFVGIGQNQSVDINSSSLKDYFEKEKDFVGGKISDSDYKTTNKDLGLISYIRSDGSVPDVDLIVRYIFFKKDSLIKEIRNEWDVANHNKKLNNRKSKDFRNDLAKFYSMLEQSLTKNYGKGTITGNLPTIVDDNNSYNKQVKWSLGKTDVELNITMSNQYDTSKKIFPSHKIYLSYQAVNLKDKPDYENAELIKRNRKPIPNIENPIVSSQEPTFPDCENSDTKISCMNNKVRDLVLKRLEKENIRIENDTLKVGFLVQIDGSTKPWKSSIKSINKELEKIGLETIENLPIMVPSYSERMKQNVSYGNSFFIIIKDNKVVNYE
ncbi:hypothetical protein [Mariniflexile rhizosphaerae]|uniref:hypothetical protein n=1 Tax=unclassified Mariniflexile TaxID=2643887 RepID=UPI0013C34DFA|nr:hypothetical protein [Mariniflexile sp. TRM1-10]